MIIEEIKNSFILYNENHDIHIREYYLYCVGLIKKRLNDYDDNINIIFGNYQTTFPNKNKTIHIDIQCEHTLVKEGGRSINNIIFGRGGAILFKYISKNSYHTPYTIHYT